MLKSFAGDAEHIILATGATDFRKQITSLSAMVTMQYHMDPFADGYVFIFCNRRRNAIKVLRYIENTISIPTTNEKLTKALNYSFNHKKELEMFLEEGRLEISNNLCESHIRPFATARRTWLFDDAPNGARANAVLYILVETARANDLNVYAYLDYLLAEMPNADKIVSDGKNGSNQQKYKVL